MELIEITQSNRIPQKESIFMSPFCEEVADEQLASFLLWQKLSFIGDRSGCHPLTYFYQWIPPTDSPADEIGNSRTDFFDSSLANFDLK
jgi:hypothetical protein